MKNRSSKLKVIIFTDLDGTLLDHETYSFEKAKPALEEIKQTETPVVFVTSKTFAEVEALQRKMGLWGREPFIVENGGAVFVPKEVFDKETIKGVASSFAEATEGDFYEIEFGTPYEQVRNVLKEAAKAVNLRVLGIGDMTAEEFSTDCGLPLEDAKRAKQRMYQEGFKILVPAEKQKEAREKIKKEIEKRGLLMSIGGRYCQIMGNLAKVETVLLLTNLFRKKYGQIITLGLGDAPADLEFMVLCDQGYLIKNPNLPVSPGAENDLPAKPEPARRWQAGKIHRTEEIGPAGWNKIVLAALEGQD